MKMYIIIIMSTPTYNYPVSHMYSVKAINIYGRMSDHGAHPAKVKKLLLKILGFSLM